MYANAKNGINKLVNWLLASEIIPIIGGISAPPATPIIIRADTSFVLDGTVCSAFENTMAKTFAHINPTIDRLAMITQTLPVNINKMNAKIATVIVKIKNLREDTRANIIEPIKVPTVRDM